MLILYVDLNGIEKLFHGIVEDTKISPPPNDIFINDLNLIIEFLSTFMKIIEKVLILIIFFVNFLTKSKSYVHNFKPLLRHVTIFIPPHPIFTDSLLNKIDV